MSLHERRLRLPDLDYLFGNAFYPGFGGDVIDPGQPLDRLIMSAIHDKRLPDIGAQLHVLLDETPDEAAAAENLLPWLSQTGNPDGPGYLDFLRAVVARVDQALDDPASIPDPGDSRDGRLTPRASRFHDQDTANRAATLVLRAHETELRQWTADSRGWWRQHYYLPDVGFSTGEVVSQGQETAEQVNGVVVVMKIDHETAAPFVYTAYPEIPLTTDVREALPDLRHVLGGYLGQDTFTDGGPESCQTNFQASTRDPARTSVREQLTTLLTKDEEDLRPAAEALGLYVLPVQLRSYLARMLWRLDAYDWTRPQGTGTVSS